jgi:hypothetical protein
MNIRIIKITDCGKLTAPNATTLTYNLGVGGSTNIHFRVTDNKTGGLFSPEWIALDAILGMVKDAPAAKPFSALIFDRLFTYRSANNAGFLVAALLAEDVLLRYKKTKRMLVLGNPDKFLEDSQPLVDSDTSLPDVVAEREMAKAKVQAENTAKLAANKTKTATVKTSTK